MIQCKIRTEYGKEKTVAWEEIREELFSLDNSERGVSHREGAFVTMWFEQNGTDDEFMQCMPDYPKSEGFFKSEVSPFRHALLIKNIPNSIPPISPKVAVVVAIP